MENLRFFRICDFRFRIYDLKKPQRRGGAEFAGALCVLCILAFFAVK